MLPGTRKGKEFPGLFLVPFSWADCATNERFPEETQRKNGVSYPTPMASMFTRVLLLGV